MSFRLSWLKKLLFILAGLIALYLLFGWFVLPGLIQSQAEKFLAEKSGYRLSMNKPEFNPVKLRLHLSGVRLEEPGGAPLMTLQDLVVQVSYASLAERAAVFDDIAFQGLEANFTLLPRGQSNWTHWLDAMKGGDTSSSSASSMPRLDIRRFALTGSKLNFTDQRMEKPFASRVDLIDVELADLSTFRNEEGLYQLSASTSFGAKFTVKGDAQLEPLSVAGSVNVTGVELDKLAPYLKDDLPVSPPSGVAGFSANYKASYAASRLGFDIDHLNVKLSGIKLHGNANTAISVAAIEAKEGSFSLEKNSAAMKSLEISDSRLADKGREYVALNRIDLEDLKVGLATHEANLGSAEIAGGRVQASLTKEGKIDLAQIAQKLLPVPKGERKKTRHEATAKASPEESKKTAASPAWRYRVAKAGVSGFAIDFRDESVTPAADFGIKDLVLGAEGISDDLKAALPVAASFKVKSGGSFEAKGKVIPAEPSANLKLKLADLSLGPAQPYLAKFARLKISGGTFSTQGTASYSPKRTGYIGDFAVRKLRLDESDTGNLFLGWDAVSSNRVEAGLDKLNVGEIAVTGLDAKLIINKDKSVNLKNILVAAESTPAPASAVAANAAPQPAVQQSPNKPEAAPGKPFAINIGRVSIRNGGMDYADYSLALPFATHIHDMKGFISGIASEGGVPSQLEFDGGVDEYGLMRSVGEIDLFHPVEYTNIKVQFANVEMAHLTPYTATFVGRKIDSGKLSLNLEYKIVKHQLQGDNQIVMDKLTLGERVESPGAMNLPLDLAIAILEDSDGRIDLGLPVSGSLDDPQFSYGSIIWKALVNVLTKIATAPFRAIGALFGGGEKLEHLAFDTGSRQLTPPEREKVVQLAGALKKRPKLSLEIYGTYAEADRGALQDRQMRRDVFDKMGEPVEGNAVPPLSTGLPKVQAALEALYADAFGKGDLLALKEGFRHANPGQMEESRTGKVLSRLSGLLENKRTLNENEVNRLKGADFHAVLFERLRAKVAVEDVRLVELANNRAKAIVEALAAASAPMERVAVMNAEKVETENVDVPVKLVIGAFKKAAPAPAAQAAPAQ
jgi:Domain of Unknown Function (DUF748)